MSTATERAEGTVAFDQSRVAESTAPLPVKVCQELHCQFESAVAFADYCSFLTAGSCGERSAQLIEIAEALMAETTEALNAAERQH